MILTANYLEEVRKWWFDADQGLLIHIGTDERFKAEDFLIFVSKTVPEEFWDWMPEQ